MANNTVGANTNIVADTLCLDDRVFVYDNIISDSHWLVLNAPLFGIGRSQHHSILTRHIRAERHFGQIRPYDYLMRENTLPLDLDLVDGVGP